MQVWPDLVLHWGVTAKIAAVLEWPRQALEAAQKAFRMAQITCAGSDGEILFQMQSLAQDAARALMCDTE